MMIDHLPRVLWGGIAALTVASCWAAGAAAAASDYSLGTPKDTVVELHEGLVAASADGVAAAGGLERFERLQPLIRATHDLPYIAQLTVRRQWRSMDESQRERFVDAFERLSVMTYAARFGEVTADTFQVGGVSEAGGGRAQVSAHIVRPGRENIPLEYVLHERDGAWRIVNIVADEVSDLALKRAEYQRILAEGTVEDLVDELEDQTRELAESAA